MAAKTLLIKYVKPEKSCAENGNFAAKPEQLNAGKLAKVAATRRVRAN